MDMELLFKFVDTIMFIIDLHTLNFQFELEVYRKSVNSQYLKLKAILYQKYTCGILHNQCKVSRFLNGWQI